MVGNGQTGRRIKITQCGFHIGAISPLAGKKARKPIGAYGAHAFATNVEEMSVYAGFHTMNVINRIGGCNGVVF